MNIRQSKALKLQWKGMKSMQGAVDLRWEAKANIALTVMGDA